MGEQVVRSVAVGLWSTCAVLEDGGVWCWGESHTGSSEAGRNRATQLPLQRVTKLLGGGERFIAITEGGGLFFWGAQWLDGERVVTAQPRPVPVGPVIDVALTFDDLCALERGGRISCWHDDGVAATPVALPDARAIAISTELRCARLASGAVSCWNDEQPPKLRAGLTDVTELVAGGNRHCARQKGGQVRCWSNQADDRALAAQLGPTALHLSATPHAVCGFGPQGLQRCVGVASGSDRDKQVAQPSSQFKPSVRLSAVAFGPSHACAITHGVVWCWASDNAFGMLGHAGEVPDGPQLVQVSLGDTAALHHVRSVGVSGKHHCVALTDGSVRCWGENDRGQLGSTPGTNRLGPTPVPGLTSVARVVVNDDTSCAVKSDATLICWGASPLVASGVAQVGLGTAYGCLLTPQGHVRCWGENAEGELGSGDSKPHAEPTAVLLDSRRELTDVAQLRVFPGHACGLTSAHRLYCWGGNQPFQQGRPYNGPATLNVATELKVAGGVLDVSDRCLLTPSSELLCWGNLPATDKAFSYEPLRVGRCAVDALATGPGACFSDSNGWACLGAGDSGPSRYSKLETASLSGVAGSRDELCGIDASGGLACFRPDGYNLRPSIGLLPMSDFEQPPARPDCKVDASPRQLPKFPRLPVGRVMAQPAGGWLHADELSSTEPGVQLSTAQVSRLLALLNDTNSYSNIATCHDPTYYYVFYDRVGHEQARVGVGDCGTIEAYPEIPAQYGHGNVVEPKLSAGVRQICRELGLEVCRQR